MGTTSREMSGARKDPAQCAGEQFSADLTRLANLRGEILGSSEQLEIATRAILQHETKRIEAKLGPDHPRTLRLNARLEAGVAVAQALEVERQVYRVAVPQVSEEGALVHGRTVDAQGRGIRGLLACLIDANGTPIREVSDATTDESGYFAHPLDPQLLERLRKQYEKGVFLGVFTTGGRLVHRSRKPLALEPAARLFTEITLDRTAVSEQGPPSPPEPAPQVVTVPDLIGLSEDEAIATLEKARLALGKRETERAPDSQGLVIAQDPTPGSKVGLGTGVDLLIGVAETDEGVVVPKVTGLKLNSARRKLADSSLELGKVEKRPSDKVDVVLEQHPKKGEHVDAGTAVNVVVGKQKGQR